MRVVTVGAIFFFSLQALFGCAAHEPCTCKLAVGACKKEILAVCGEPNKVNTLRLNGVLTEQWVYYYYDDFLGYRPDIAQYFVYVRNDRVIALQN